MALYLSLSRKQNKEEKIEKKRDLPAFNNMSELVIQHPLLSSYIWLAIPPISAVYTHVQITDSTISLCWRLQDCVTLRRIFNVDFFYSHTIPT